jgi:hypothetical protein
MPDPQHRDMVEELSQRKNSFLAHPADTGGGGVLVHFKRNQSIKLSLCIAALQLLRSLHREGWVHGDSHLGNFVYSDGRVFAIDFERSFASASKVQHLMDIQEAFGHISGLMMNAQHEWDLRDIPGVYFHRSRACSAPK